MIERFRSHITIFYGTSTVAQDLKKSFQDLTRSDVIDEFMLIGLDEEALTKIMEKLG